MSKKLQCIGLVLAFKMYQQRNFAAEVQQAGQAIQDSQIQGGQVSLGCWQPDIVCISLAKKKIAIGPEVSLPSDSRMEALQEAHNQKTQSCHSVAR